MPRQTQAKGRQSNHESGASVESSTTSYGKANGLRLRRRSLSAAKGKYFMQSALTIWSVLIWCAGAV